MDAKTPRRAQSESETYLLKEVNHGMAWIPFKVTSTELCLARTPFE